MTFSGSRAVHVGASAVQLKLTASISAGAKARSHSTPIAAMSMNASAAITFNSDEKIGVNPF
jgi:hypothetical protein